MSSSCSRFCKLSLPKPKVTQKLPSTNGTARPLVTVAGIAGDAFLNL